MNNEQVFQHKLGEEWFVILKDFVLSDKMDKVGRAIMASKLPVYPSKDNIFRIFKEIPYSKVKVVILGQDPYHDGSATGVAFGNSADTRVVSPSLSNVFTELEKDLDIFQLEYDYTLQNWIDQGVFLINTALTVEKGKAGSHTQAWVEFTVRVLQELSKRDDIIWVLWGRHANLYYENGFIKANHIISSAHPSPLSAYKGFFGSKPFSKCNTILKSLDKEEIKWY